MAKKFFYNRVYNTKRTIINLIIIGVCVIGVIICFIITSNFQGESHKKGNGELVLKEATTVEVNDTLNVEMFFDKIENVDLSTIKVNYPEDFDISKVGTYEVSLEVSGKPYTTNLIVVDTLKPVLKLKEVRINENASYKAQDFVESCSDNSKHECSISFYEDGTNEDGEKIDYSSYKKSGTYPIKIAAQDEAGNTTIEEVNLIIGEVTTTNPEPGSNPEHTTCKYGTAEYDTNEYLLASNVTTNGCALSLDLWKDETIAAEINRILETETTRIKKDVTALKLSGIPAISRNIITVTNKTGDGIVGYALTMVVRITDNNETKTVAEYRVNSEGRRVFITNPYNLAN